ncbi:MAG: RNA polymerase sigma factor [Phycisphaerales bacterium]
MTMVIEETGDGDAADIVAARLGDQNAFARLYDRHAAVVLSFCRGCLVSGVLADADDACQLTFLRAFAKLDDVTAPATFRRWLLAIAGNVCRERIRAARRRSTHEMTAAQLHLHHQQRNHVGPAAETVTSNAASSSIERREQLDKLTTAIDQLDERQRLAIHLYYLESDPVAAAARDLALSRSAFYKLLQQARAQLAAALTASGVHHP